jgi:hypothetical protein
MAGQKLGHHIILALSLDEVHHRDAPAAANRSIAVTNACDLPASTAVDAIGMPNWWCTAVAIACDLLAWLRLLALDHHQKLTRASPAILRRALLNLPARAGTPLPHTARGRLARTPWP